MGTGGAWGSAREGLTTLGHVFSAAGYRTAMFGKWHLGNACALRPEDRGFEAVVTMQVDEKYSQFPADTIASIFTSGLLGEQYVSLDPGGDIKLLENQSEIRHTQSAMVLEQLIGQFLFNQGADKKDENPF